MRFKSAPQKLGHQWRPEPHASAHLVDQIRAEPAIEDADAEEGYEMLAHPESVVHAPELFS
jgi:hypothetical protein